MYAEFEGALGELERARAIFSLAIGLSNQMNEGNEATYPTLIALDMPERVWKAYIDFEVENG